MSDKPTITIGHIFGHIPEGEFLMYDLNGNLLGEFEVDEKQSDTVFTYRKAWPEIIEEQDD